VAVDSLVALRRILRRAAADQFSGVLAAGIGPELRETTDAFLRCVVPNPAEDALVTQLRGFRTGLTEFETRGMHDRTRVVAHGLRVCMALDVGRHQPTVTASRRPSLGRKPKKMSKTRLRQQAETEVSPGVAKKGNSRGSRAGPVGTKKSGKRDSANREPSSGDAPADGKHDPVGTLPGVGPKTAKKLEARGLSTIEDLVFLLPLGYVDLRRRDRLAAVEEGQRAVVEGVVRGFRQGWFGGRYHARLDVEQEGTLGGHMEARWFHPFGGMGSTVTTGDIVVLAGTIKSFRGKMSMIHPDVLDPEGKDPGIAIRYPVVEGVGQRTLRKICLHALDRFCSGNPTDVLPKSVVETHGLLALEVALRDLHCPSDDISEEDVTSLDRRGSVAHQRLAFEEHFFVQISLLQKRAQWQQAACTLGVIGAGAFDRESLRASVPFEPTGAQWRVIDDIEKDMGIARPMLRLLQGDVGSGKTLVAFAAALAVSVGGGQSAIMAPTEILAEQHLRTLGSWCERAGLRIALLTGSIGRPQRKTLLSLVAAGQIDILVGTHALLVDDVQFASLALVVVDEQHRFGVEQRSALRDKGRAPHLLVMTATPIPRSLALTAFGELEVSVIDELPPGREAPVTTLYAGKVALKRARSALKREIDSGTKAFVVCPLVEESEAIHASNVEDTAAELRELMPKVAIGVVHGRMPSKEKDAVMRQFRDGELRVLVATTVIEVGVDIPDATVILIEHAERFGLAQLHQLRGRVGRSSGASNCYLHTVSSSESDAGQRLKILERSSDGFEVAETDLQMRGPGEVFGTQQSGVPRLRFTSLVGEGMRMLHRARDAAKTLIEEDPSLAAYPEIREEIERRLNDGGVHAGESG